MSLSKRSAAEFIGTFWLVLGGCGSQGRAALYDLSRNESVDFVFMFIYEQ